MSGVGIRLLWIALLLAVASTAAGCQNTSSQDSRAPRTLTSSDLKSITAGGGAAASNEMVANGLGSMSEAAVAGAVSAASGSMLTVQAPILHYASADGKAYAQGNQEAWVWLLERLSVHESNRRLELLGIGMSRGAVRAEATTQFYGVSTKTADIAFGSVRANACCGNTAEVQVNVYPEAVGSYTSELRDSRLVSAPGEQQGRTDLAVVSSTIPLLQPDHALAAQSLTWLSPKY